MDEQRELFEREYLNVFFCEPEKAAEWERLKKQYDLTEEKPKVPTRNFLGFVRT